MKSHKQWRTQKIFMGRGRAGLKGTGGPEAIFIGGPLWRISWRHRL